MGFKATGAMRRPRSAGAGGTASRARGEKGAARPAGQGAKAPARKPVRGPSLASEHVERGAAPRDESTAGSPFAPRADWHTAVRTTVEGLRYDLVDVERAPRGLLRVTIDRRPGQSYAAPGEAVTVDDCEVVTRQLQYALEVDGVDYARLEVSSPGLDRPLRSEADYERFAGQAINLALRQPFQGRKHYQGRLDRAAAGWQLTFEDGKATQVLSFAFDEVREARLVPAVDFKGRAGRAAGTAGPAPAAEAEHDKTPGGQAASARETEEGRNR